MAIDFKSASTTEVDERPAAPQFPEAPQRARGWGLLAVAAIIIAAGIAAWLITSDDPTSDAAADLSSGESVYLQYDWYGELGGFYLPPPALAPSSESAYAGFDWYEKMGGFELPEPYVELGSGESVYSEFDWYAKLGGFYLPPPAAG